MYRQRRTSFAARLTRGAHGSGAATSISGGELIIKSVRRPRAAHVEM